MLGREQRVLYLKPYLCVVKILYTKRIYHMHAALNKIEIKPNMCIILQQLIFAQFHRLLHSFDVSVTHFTKPYIRERIKLAVSANNRSSSRCYSTHLEAVLSQALKGS